MGASISQSVNEATLESIDRAMHLLSVSPEKGNFLWKVSFQIVTSTIENNSRLRPCLYEEKTPHQPDPGLRGEVE